MRRLMYDLLVSRGYKNTIVSLRLISEMPKRYTNLLMNTRSSLSSVGIMLVPSTLTGWYRNRITTTAIITLMNRSRIQLMPAFGAGAALGTGAATVALSGALISGSSGDASMW